MAGIALSFSSPPTIRQSSSPRYGNGSTIDRNGEVQAQGQATVDVQCGREG
jgi:hypothetical protein